MKNTLIALTIVLSFIAGMMVKSNKSDVYNVTYNYPVQDKDVARYESYYTTEYEVVPWYETVDMDNYDYSDTGSYGEGYGYGEFDSYEDYLKNNPLELEQKGPSINYTSDPKTWPKPIK